MSTSEIVLGDPESSEKTETVRGLAFRSRRGLRATERLLIDSLPESAPERLLSGLDTEGSVALAARRIFGQGLPLITIHTDAYVAAKVERVLAQNETANVQVLLAGDIPGVTVPGEPEPTEAASFDLIALPFPSGGEAIFAREIIEEAHAALRPGGRLLASVDDEKGAWLRKVVKEVFGKVSLAGEDEDRGVCLSAVRTREKVVVRDHRHTITATLKGRKLVLESRPGVFGHERLDPGTRALAERIEVSERDRVLDLGCGYGTLGLLAASLAPEGRAVLADSSVRAVSLAERNARTNSLPNAVALLRADLEDLGDEPFDLALANPPYYSNFRIATAFVRRAHEMLRDGGRLALVAKAKDEHLGIVRSIFGDAELEDVPGGYGIVRATKR
ncbi:methyltransferase [bacterium]|nr:methyltransferase [bacterium]